MKLKDAEKEQRIKAATLEVVADTGMAGVKMAAVAKKAGLSPSSLYVYYKSKEELLLAVFRDTLSLMFFVKEQELDESIPYKARIEKIYRRIIGFKQHNAGEYHFLKQFMNSPYFDEEVKESVKDIWTGIHMVIAYGQEQMILKDMDIHLVFAALDGVTDKLVEYSTKKKLTLSEKTIDDAFQVVWDGIKQ